MKRILFFLMCVSLIYSELVEPIPAAFADVNTPDKNAPSIQAAKDSNLPAVKNEQKEDGFQLSEAANNGDIEKIKELIAKGYNVNIRDDSNWTPLHRALQSGHKEAAKLLIANGADVNAQNDRNVSPIILAAIYDYNDIVEMLIAKGAEKTIYVAAAQGDIEGVKGWLKKDPNLVNALTSNDGWSALHWAAYMNRSDVIRVLIENGTNVNIRGDKLNKVTPLFWAIRKGRLDAAKLLIDKGAEVKIKNEGGGTLLHFPGTLETARLLIDNGADVNAKTDQGITPLHSIATKDNLNVVQRLLTDKSGWTGSTWKTEFEKQRNAAEKIITEIAELLIKKGADINAKDKNGRTALFVAAQSGQTELVKFLLQKGADINTADADIDAKEDRDGSTALWRAAQNGHLEIAKFLLEKGADVNAKDIGGGTALLMAADEGHTEIVKLLLGNGAEVNAKTNDGKTALGLAKKKGHTDIVQMLEKAGAKE